VFSVFYSISIHSSPPFFNFTQPVRPGERQTNDIISLLNFKLENERKREVANVWQAV
jgi:hypothetical protein